MTDTNTTGVFEDTHPGRPCEYPEVPCVSAWLKSKKCGPCANPTPEAYYRAKANEEATGSLCFQGSCHCGWSCNGRPLDK